MNVQTKKYLFDILYSINLISDFIQGMNFLEYEKDLKTKNAVEHQLGIIGKAVNKFSKQNTGYELTNTREIINFRNRIIHSYDSIDDNIVWAIKTNHLSVLKAEIEELLKK